MNIKQCTGGHFYDADRYPSGCPYCQTQNPVSGMMTFFEDEAAQPQQSAAPVQEVGATMPTYQPASTVQPQQPAAPVQEVGATMPAYQPASTFQPQQPAAPVHQTPEERTVRDGQILRNGRYTNAFGEEKSFAWAYHWVMQMGWVWSVSFPLVAIRDMADDEDEFLRVLRIVFSTAGKNEFMDSFAVEGLRNYLGVPHEIGRKDARIMAGYIKFLLDCQLVPCELTAFEKDECRIHVTADDFSTTKSS